MTLSTPEWDLFKRVEELEDIALELLVKPDANPTLETMARDIADVKNLAIFNFINAARRDLREIDPEEYKSTFFKIFGENFSDGFRESLEKFLDAAIYAMKDDQTD